MFLVVSDLGFLEKSRVRFSEIQLDYTVKKILQCDDALPQFQIGDRKFAIGGFNCGVSLKNRVLFRLSPSLQSLGLIVTENMSNVRADS
jgi:hypothetical protein